MLLSIMLSEFTILERDFATYMLTDSGTLLVLVWYGTGTSTVLVRYCIGTRTFSAFRGKYSICFSTSKHDSIHQLPGYDPNEIKIPK